MLNKYKIVPGSSSMYREGGSYCCRLRNSNGDSFELIFPIKTEKLNWSRLEDLHERKDVEELDRGANLHLLYHSPEVYHRRFGQKLIEKPGWREAYDFLAKAVPSDHPHIAGKLPESLGGVDYIIDHMADMVETARQNMERESGNPIYTYDD